MKLTQLKKGDSATILKIDLEVNYTNHLISLGFVVGNTITFERTAPLGDPQQYYIAGNYVALRKEDAERIEVE
ncbi:MAG: FeoA family protein [Bacilli bacterium]